MDAKVTKKDLYAVIDDIISDCKKTGCNAVEALLLVKSNIHVMAPSNPHVMSLEELKKAKICWIEDEDDGMESRLFPAVVYGTGQRANNDKAIIFLAYKPWCADRDDYEWWYDIKDYLKWWRPWSEKPTDEQMEAQEWNE